MRDVLTGQVHTPQTSKKNINWTIIFFFSSLESPDAMFKSGLYINDLSMHDSSRDLVLAGTQQSAELKLALDQVGGAASNSYSSLTTIKGGV